MGHFWDGTTKGHERGFTKSGSAQAVVTQGGGRRGGGK